MLTVAILETRIHNFLTLHIDREDVVDIEMTKASSTSQGKKLGDYLFA